MFHQTIRLPAPFHMIEVFSLVEPVGETETEVHFGHRLYMVVPRAKGGKVLLMEGHGYTLPKNILAQVPQETEGQD
ncbi:hypothetical protein GEU84_004560 [Fertoebacter nigrum]|uniref:Uncharacterized protein n=1 Tax=Fertoeibacter niger TaxID=2656921 RepID=A0A8X8GXH8_9RHOB|nr:hypothetical protein [Fertoeibacter niger]NUB43648.1 hypothetical protein [Fertoeibacter niger]